MPSLASHDQFSVTYEEQTKFAEDFYSGNLPDAEAAAALNRYGVHYVVVPNDSPGRRFLSGRRVVGVSGPWTIYELPDGARPRYPGLVALRPEYAAKMNFGAMLVRARRIFTP